MSTPLPPDQSPSNPSQNASGSLELTPSSAREGLLSLLDSEIEEIQTESTRSGWSVWAILAAIAGALWLLTDELKAASFNQSNAVRVFIGGVALFDVLNLIYKRCNFTSQAADEEPRFYWSETFFAANRMQLILELIRVVSLVLITYFSGYFNWYLFTSLLIGYGTFLLVVLLGLLLPIFAPRFTLSPQLATRAQRISSNIWWLFLTVPHLVFLGLLIKLLPYPSGAFISDYRIGGLLSVIVYLLVILVSVITTSSALQPLVELRRKLVFGKINLENAKIQTEIALGGMTAVDALRDNYINLIYLIDIMNGQVRDVSMSLQAMEANIPDPKNDDQKTSALKLTTLVAIERGYKHFLEERGRYWIQCKQQFDDFIDKAKWILRSLPAVYPTINQIEQQLKARIELSDRQYFSLLDKHDEILKRVNKNPADAPNDKKL